MGECCEFFFLGCWAGIAGVVKTLRWAGHDIEVRELPECDVARSSGYTVCTQCETERVRLDLRALFTCQRAWGRNSSFPERVQYPAAVGFSLNGLSWTSQGPYVCGVHRIVFSTQRD